MGFVLFIYFAWMANWRIEAGCPRCIRLRTARFALVNLITANVLWPVIILPVAIFHLARSFTHGHSDQVTRLLEDPDNAGGVHTPTASARKQPAAGDSTTTFDADDRNHASAGASEIAWFWACLTFTLIVGGGVFALVRVMQGETEGFRALFVAAAPVAGALAALGATLLLRNKLAGRSVLLGFVGLALFLMSGVAPWICLVLGVHQFVT